MPQPASGSAVSSSLSFPGDVNELDEKIGIVHIVSGRTANGEEFYAYISVKPSVYEKFFLTMAAAGEPFNLLAYGDILHAGFGLEPSAEVMAEMEKKHGIDHFLIQKAMMS